MPGHGMAGSNRDDREGDPSSGGSQEPGGAQASFFLRPQCAAECIRESARKIGREGDTVSGLHLEGRGGGAGRAHGKLAGQSGQQGGEPQPWGAEFLGCLRKIADHQGEEEVQVAHQLRGAQSEVEIGREHPDHAGGQVPQQSVVPEPHARSLVCRCQRLPQKGCGHSTHLGRHCCALSIK